jgi:hypothetical protein
MVVAMKRTNLLLYFILFILLLILILLFGLGNHLVCIPLGLCMPFYVLEEYVLHLLIQYGPLKSQLSVNYFFSWP